MGCGGSKIDPEAFLATPQPAPAEGYVKEWPRAVKMTGWSFNSAHHSPSDAETIFNMVGSDDPGGYYHDTRGVGSGGTGEAEELAICDLDNKPLGSLLMPKHLSFGIGAQLKDDAGNVIALLCTAEKKRPHGMFSSAYNVLVARPQYDGQAPVGGSWYLWAKVKRAPFTNAVKVFNGKDEEVGKGYTYKGSVRSGHGNAKWKSETAAGAGLMLSLPMADGGRTRHHVQCAEGVDTAMQILLMYASKLALDELYQPPPQSDDGFGGGDD